LYFIIEDSFLSFNCETNENSKCEGRGEVISFMKVKPLYLLNIILSIVLLTSLLVNAATNRSVTTSTSKYDPWTDINDDGVIDGQDAVMLIDAIPSSGTPINKTALLLELQARVDSLNASLLDSEAYFNTRITTLNASFVDLQSQVGTLHATVNSLIERVNALEANYSVTNLKLAPNAIPFNSADGTTTIYANNTLTFKEMADMVVNITLSRPSQVLIMFSANALQSSDGVQHIEIMALVNESYLASPGPVYLNPGVSVDIFFHSHYLPAGSFTYVFYALINEAGTYTIKIKWRVTGGTGQIGYRSLTVIGLPA
jgi:hypothetical protein